MALADFHEDHHRRVVDAGQVFEARRDADRAFRRSY
jgi:hypothetical protein